MAKMTDLFCPLIKGNCVGSKCVCIRGSGTTDVYCELFHKEGLFEGLHYAIEAVVDISSAIDKKHHYDCPSL